MQRSVLFEGVHSQKESYFCPQTIKNKAVIEMNGCKENDKKFLKTQQSLPTRWNGYEYSNLEIANVVAVCNMMI